MTFRIQYFEVGAPLFWELATTAETLNIFSVFATTLMQLRSNMRVSLGCLATQRKALKEIFKMKFEKKIRGNFFSIASHFMFCFLILDCYQRVKKGREDEI